MAPPAIWKRLVLVLTVSMAAALAPLTAGAEDTWNPFADDPTTRPARPSPPKTSAPPAWQQPAVRSTPGFEAGGDAGRYQPPPNGFQQPPGYDRTYPEPRDAGLNRQPRYQPYDPNAGAPAQGLPLAPPKVEKGELAPVMSTESGLPYGSWQGLSSADIEQLLSPLQLPARSPTLQNLFVSVLSAPDAAGRSEKLTALRAEALFRSGRLDEASAVLATLGPATSKLPAVSLLKARIEIPLGNTDAGCQAAKSAGQNKSKLPRQWRGEAIVLAGYCAVAAGNKAAAGIAAELARDEGYRNRFALDILDAIANGRQKRRILPKTIRAIDYLLLKAAGFDQAEKLVPKASPALLGVMLSDRELSPQARLTAAEQAAADNVIGGGKLADAYRQYRGSGAAAPAPAAERAALFQDAEAIPTPLRRTRSIRRLIDSAQRAGIALTAMIAVKPMVDQLHPVAEISWFSMTAIEISLAAGDYDGVLPWLALAQASERTYTESLQHWAVLADIANPARDRGSVNLAPLEGLAARNRMSGPMLRRLTTVLDALDYNVPIPVWDAANRAPKDTTGQLPPTGVLTQLLEASKARETARTALLTMRSINGSTAREAHLIALGDSIRALKRSGLEKDARRLAFEAVFASWPRPSGY